MASKLQVELDVIDKGTKVLKSVGAEFNGLQNKIMAFAKAATAIFAGGVIVRQLTGMAQAAIDFGDNIADSSAKLGLSSEAYQKWSYVAKVSGSEINNLSKAFPILAKQAASSNQILGISTREANGSLRDSSALFSDVLMRIAAIENPTERAAVSLKLFGKSGKDVFAIASQGKDRISELIGETERYGLILSDQAVNQLNGAKDAQDRLNLAWKVATANLTLFIIPAMETYIPLLQKVVNLIPGTKQAAAAEAASTWTSNAAMIKTVNADMIKYNELTKNGTLTTVKYGDEVWKIIQKIEKETGMSPGLLKNVNFEALIPNAEIAAKKKTAPSQFDDLFEKDKTSGKKGGKSDQEKRELEDREKYYKKVEDAAASHNARIMAEKDLQYNIWKSAVNRQDKAAEDDLKRKKEFADREVEIEKWKARVEGETRNNLINATMTSTDAMASLANLAVRNSRANAREQKNIMIGIALIQQGVAAAIAIRSGWNEGAAISPWLGAVDAAAAGIVAIASFASTVASIQSASFARGGSFVTSGPQVIVVGDNPGGRERVDITPTSSTNYNGPKEAVAHFHFYDNSGRETESFKRKIRSGEMDGVIPALKQRMALL